MNSVKFNIHAVEIGNTTKIDHLQKNFIKLAQSRLLGDVLSVSDNLQNKIYGQNVNGFFKAVHDAYNNHLPLEIHPDHIHLLILQGLSIHINENAEQFRSLFVNHQGKKTLIINNDNNIEETQWTELFSDFADKISHDIIDKELVNLTQIKFQTSTSNTIAAFNIALMDIVKIYYSYMDQTCCGIPYIIIKGSVTDWEDIYKLVSYIEKYELSWWTEKLKPIINEFINVSKGLTPDLNFWQDIVKIKGGSGGPYYNGWLTHLFPYKVGYKGAMYKYNFVQREFDFPSGLSQVSCFHKISDDVQGNENINFTSGFFGYTINKNVVCPEISWAVHKRVIK